jgi:GNAT superfamily N-acetyltransferase
VAVAVREAGPDDATALAAVFGRAWLHAYESLLPYDELSRWDDEADRRALWARVLADPAEVVLVATTGDDVVRGFVVVRPARGEAELVALYVDPPAQGAGVGGLLLAGAVAGMTGMGCASVAAWVIEGNAHALAWAAALGWTVGTEPRQDEGWPAPSLRVELAL